MQLCQNITQPTVRQHFLQFDSRTDRPKVAKAEKTSNETNYSWWWCNKTPTSFFFYMTAAAVCLVPTDRGQTFHAAAVSFDCFPTRISNRADESRLEPPSPSPCRFVSSRRAVLTGDDGGYAPADGVVEPHVAVVDVARLRQHAVYVQPLHEHPGERAHVEVVEEDGDHRAHKLEKVRKCHTRTNLNFWMKTTCANS